MKHMLKSAAEKNIVYWRQGENGASQNFGDLLSELIAKHILLQPFCKAHSFRIIGSCIADFIIDDTLSTSPDPDSKIAFWGCGMRDERPLDPALQKRCQFFGVRGPLTRDILGLSGNTVIGDTGLLLPLIHSPSSDRTSAGRSVCIPHMHERRSDTEIEDITGADLIVRPALVADEGALRRMIDTIVSARFVLCGSLHAAITAHAYGTPFAFCDAGFVDLPFKWRDFAASIKIPAVFVRSVEEGLTAYERVIGPSRKHLPFIPILEASPFSIRPEIAVAARAYDLSRGLQGDARAGPSTIAVPVRLGPLEEPEQGDVEGPIMAKQIAYLNELIHEKTREREVLARQLERAEAAQEQTLAALLDVRGAVDGCRQLQAEVIQRIASLSVNIDRSIADTRFDEALAEAESARIVLETTLDDHRRSAAAVAAAHKAAEDRALAAEAELERSRAGHRTEEARWSEERDDLLARLKDAAAAADSRQSRIEDLSGQLSVSSQAEKTARALHDQTQALIRHQHQAAEAQARRLDGYDRRLSVVGFRASILAELSTVRFQSGHRGGVLLGETHDKRYRKLSRKELSFVRGALVKRRLFDADWYRRSEPSATGLDDDVALQHFVVRGIPAGRDPHPLISISWLARQMGQAADTSPLLALPSRRSGLQPHPLFDAAFYLATYPDVEAYGGTPFEHYMADGAAEGRIPHAAFEPSWYIRQLPVREKPPSNPLADYLSRPERFGFDPHPLFDARRYLRELAPDAPVNPLLHYILRGEGEKRRPHALFEPSYYELRNPDVAAAGLSPLVHFLRSGATEHRVTHPLFDPVYYARTNADLPDAVHNPLRHYLLCGAANGLSPREDWLDAGVADAFPGLGRGGRNPLIAFLDGEGIDVQVLAPRNRDGSNPKTAGARIDPEPARRDPASAPGIYHLPQALREYVDMRHGAETVTYIRDLMAVIDRFDGSPNTFAASADFHALANRLRVAAGERAEAPDTSIIVPVHNALVYTLTCLVSVLETETRSSYEILVADDASTDETPNIVPSIGGRVRLIRQDANQGFLRNCNLAAAEARGHHLLFLNNDTLALPGWLDALVDLADRDPRIGFVGSKLLNADGSLQEAGGIIWRDGSAWNYGRGGDPNDSAFNFVRDVDYCSGASILIPATVWRELNGFDTEFAPAYCEDSDFAFRTREAGHRTVYQPYSEVIHHEGRSHGRDASKGIKHYQTINSAKLFARWQDTLARENFGNGEQIVRARSRSRDRAHLLVVDHYIPQWDRDAGSRTMYHFLRAFVQSGLQVTFWSDNLYQDRRYARDLQELGIEIIYGARYSGKFASWISENRNVFSYVILSRPHISIKYIGAIRSVSSALVFYYGHDLHWRRLLDEYEATGSREALRLSREFKELETQLWMLSDVIMYPSESERAIVAEAFPTGKGALAVPAWTFDAGAVEAVRVLDDGGRDPHHLLFVGGFGHGPNVDGILWFTSEILPILRGHSGRFRVTIAGSNAPEQVLAVAAPDVHVLGFVSDDDLAGLYREVGIAIAPLRFGGGVKGKVVEALSKGVPVVTTGVGVQGLKDPETMAFVADTPADFAAAVIRAAEDRAMAAARVDAAAEFVIREYSADTLMRQLRPFMPDVAERSDLAHRRRNDGAGSHDPIA